MKVEILDDDIVAGILEYNGLEYIFCYDSEFLANKDTTAISVTMPKRKEPYISKKLHPFFSSLLSEGNLRDIQSKLLKLDKDDDFAFLVHTAKYDTIGSVRVGKVL
jgi:serine/threonine-protein kinase HipA